MKDYIIKLKKIITLLILFYVIYNLNIKSAYCVVIKDTGQESQLLSFIVELINDFILQEKFLNIYASAWQELITIEISFIETFVKTLDLKTIIENSDNKVIKEYISTKFLNYLDEKILYYTPQILFNNCNSVLPQTLPALESLLSDQELLDAFKENLCVMLNIVRKHHLFIGSYVKLPFFKFFFVNNIEYICDFVDNLPFHEILISSKYTSTEELFKHILDLFIKDVKEKQKQLENFGPCTIRLMPVITFIYSTIKSYISYGNIISSKDFMQAHPEATENEPIITPGYFAIYDIICKKKNRYNQPLAFSLRTTEDPGLVLALNTRIFAFYFTFKIKIW